MCSDILSALGCLSVGLLFLFLLFLSGAFLVTIYLRAIETLGSRLPAGGGVGTKWSEEGTGRPFPADHRPTQVIHVFQDQ